MAGTFTLKCEKKIFIMGNGPSLSQLSAQEREVVGRNDSLAMNAYLLHASKIGLVPTHYLLEDGGPDNFRSLKDIPGIVTQEEFSKIELWLSEDWFNRFNECKNKKNLIQHTHWYLGNMKVSYLPFSMDAWKNNYNLTYDYIARIFADVPLTLRKIKQFWAYELNDPLFHFRGTLTAAINLVWLLGYKEIHLIGVDLNDGMHFYENDPDIVKRDSSNYGIDANKKHATSVYFQDKPP
ncbi:hypothetical protein KAR91_25375, partial [Candidatus Pacearchaeota archaeon]|nr:hypothetical protein [Candidatus Pacearchaeota archaeon]